VDFAIAASVLSALLIAIPAITAFFQRQNRLTRRENRQLRVLAQEDDLHLFALERELTRRGIRPPVRPAPLQALATGDDDDDGGDPDAPASPASAGPAAGGDAGAGGGARHRSG
jgi:hypothetical protein